MATNHVVVWLDHVDAHVIHFTPETAATEIISSPASHHNLHIKAGKPGSGHAAENTRYFDAIAESVKGSLEILVVGPGGEKLALFKHLQKHQHTLAENVVGVETVDHPTDGQLLAFARKYFVRADRMR